MKNIVGISAILIISLLLTGLANLQPAMAEGTVVVSINAPNQVNAGASFTASIDVGQVTDLNAVQYDIKFNPSLLTIESVTKGKIGTTTVSALVNPTGQGVYTVVQSLGLSTVSGEGTLAMVNFRAKSVSSQSTSISLTNGVLSGMSGPIPANWPNITLNIASTGGTSPTPTPTNSIPTNTVTPTPTTGSGTTGGGSSGTSLNTVATTGLSSAGEVLKVNSSGVTQGAAQIKTADNQAVLNIAGNTKLVNAIGSPLTTLTAAVLALPPAPPANNKIVRAHTFGPDGARFEPPLTLTMTYDPAELGAGITENSLQIACFVNNQWQGVNSSVDTQSKTVSAPVDHFSTWAIMGKMATPTTTATPSSPATATAAPGASASSPSAPQSAVATRIAEPSKPAESIPTSSAAAAEPPKKAATGSDWPLIGGIIGGVLIVIVTSFYFIGKRLSRGRS